MKKMEYIKEQQKQRDQLLRERWNGLERDPDIWNLEYMATAISPGSTAWRMGQIKTLRRAIKALERENRERDEAKETEAAK